MSGMCARPRKGEEDDAGKETRGIPSGNVANFRLCGDILPMSPDGQTGGWRRAAAEWDRSDGENRDR